MNDGFVMKLDRFGQDEWYTFLGGVGSNVGIITDLSITSDDHLVLSGDGGYMSLLDCRYA